MRIDSPKPPITNIGIGILERIEPTDRLLNLILNACAACTLRLKNERHHSNSVPTGRPTVPDFTFPQMKKMAKNPIS